MEILEGQYISCGDPEGQVALQSSIHCTWGASTTGVGRMGLAEGTPLAKQVAKQHKKLIDCPEVRVKQNSRSTCLIMQRFIKEWGRDWSWYLLKDEGPRKRKASKMRDGNKNQRELPLWTSRSSHMQGTAGWAEGADETETALSASSAGGAASPFTGNWQLNKRQSQGFDTYLK